MRIRTFFAIAAMGMSATVAYAQDAMTEHQAAMETMMSSMHGMTSSGDPDMDFTMMMIPHHQSAIDMARVQLKYGKDPALRALAGKVISDQKREIAEMKAWQAAHGR